MGKRRRINTLGVILTNNNDLIGMMEAIEIWGQKLEFKGEDCKDYWSIYLRLLSFDLTH